MKAYSVFFLLLAAFGLAACGGSTEVAHTGKESAAETTGSTTAAQTEAHYPVPAAPPKKKPLKKLVVKNLEVGSGPVAHWGDEVTVRYVGLFYKTGEIYSQHWNYSNSFKIERRKSYGSGWDGGIQGMRVGGRRELLIPSDLLFGDGDVAYVVELLGVKPGPGAYRQKPPFSAIIVNSTINVNGGDKEPKFEPPDRRAPKKLLFRELEPGYGPPAGRGDEVAIRYAGAMYETGEVRYGGRAGPFRLGSGGLGSAFERGLEGMRLGERRELIVPSRFLGNSGAVDYVIEVVDLVKGTAR